MRKLFLTLIVFCLSLQLFGQNDSYLKKLSKFKTTIKLNDVEKLKELDFVNSEFLNHKDFGVKPIAFVILETGNKKMIEYLISKGADLNNVNNKNGSAFTYIPYYWYLKYRNDYGPKIDALTKLPCKTRYYKKNIDVNKNLDLAKYLHSKGALLNCNQESYNPWVLTVKYDELDILKFFVKINDNKIPEKLHAKLMLEACTKRNYDFVKFFIDTGMSGDQEDENKFSAIARAANSPKITRFLFKNGAKINKIGYLGTTPIMHASRDGCVISKATTRRSR